MPDYEDLVAELPTELEMEEYTISESGEVRYEPREDEEGGGADMAKCPQDPHNAPASPEAEAGHEGASQGLRQQPSSSSSGYALQRCRARVE